MSMCLKNWTLILPHIALFCTMSDLISIPKQQKLHSEAYLLCSRSYKLASAQADL